MGENPGCFAKLVHPELPFWSLLIDKPGLVNAVYWRGCPPICDRCMPAGGGPLEGFGIYELIKTGDFIAGPAATLVLFAGEHGEGRSFTLHSSKRVNLKELPLEQIGSLRLICTQPGSGRRPSPKR